MPLIRLEDGGARTFGAGRIGVRSGAPLEVEDATMRATFTVAEGERLGFSVRWASAEDGRPGADGGRTPSPRASPTPSRAGARGRPSTTSTTGRTATSCA